MIAFPDKAVAVVCAVAAVGLLTFGTMEYRAAVDRAQRAEGARDAALQRVGSQDSVIGSMRLAVEALRRKEAEQEARIAKAGAEIAARRAAQAAEGRRIQAAQIPADCAGAIAWAIDEAPAASASWGAP